jgi:hypothetical protein
MLGLLRRKIKKILFMQGFDRLVSNVLPALDGRTVLVICTGPSIRNEKCNLEKFIKQKIPFVIGVNDSFSLYRLDACLITNTKHFRKVKGQLADLKYPVWLGWNIPESDLLELSLRRVKWLDIFYYNSRYNESLEFFNKIPNQDLRTSGSLAICLAYLAGAKNVYVAGMDGYTEVEFDLMKADRARHQRSLMDENRAALGRLLRRFGSSSTPPLKSLTKTAYGVEMADWEDVIDGNC